MKCALRICLALLAITLQFTPAMADWKVDVVKVIDGDSLVLCYLGGKPSYGYRPGKKVEVRLQGIDAPEYRQAGGPQAAKALAGILDGAKDASLKPLGEDRYGRVLGMLYVMGPSGRLWVNELMVAKGHAWAYRRYTHDRRLIRAEKNARRQRLGLWSQKSPEPPWKYRARHRR